MQLFNYIDSKLLNHHQKFADWFQTWFAKDCFFLGIFCLTVRCLLGVWGMSVMLRFHDILYIVFDILITTIAIFFGKRTITRQTKNYNEYSPLMKFYRLIQFFFLVISLILLPTLISSEDTELRGLQYAMINTAATFFMMLGFYFVSCTPMPPSKSKLSKLLGELRERISTSGLKPATVPA